MHNPAAVGSVKCVGNLNAELQQLVDLERTVLDLVLQGLTIEKLHRDKCLRILLTDVVDGADVGMIEGGGGLCLPTEAAERLRIARHFVRQELQSDETVQTSVLGLVNYAHTTTTELLDDLVVRDGLVDHNAPACRPLHLTDAVSASQRIPRFWTDCRVLPFSVDR